MRQRAISSSRDVAGARGFDQTMRRLHSKVEAGKVEAGKVEAGKNAGSSVKMSQGGRGGLPGPIRKSVFANALAGVALIVPLHVVAESVTEVSPPGLTGNLGIVSDYRYRGISQTEGKPAIQAGLDYGHSTGIYLGTWWTNISWLSDAGAGQVSSSVELDFYGGFKRSLGDFTYDVGVLRYQYPGSYPDGFTSPNTTEVYAAGSWKMLTLKYSQSVTNLFGFADSKGSGYLDLSGTFDVGAGFNLIAHLGHQWIPAGEIAGMQVRSKDDCSYTDWRLGVARQYVGLNWALAYVDTDARGSAGECYRNAFNRNLGKSTLVLSIGKTF